MTAAEVGSRLERTKPMSGKIGFKASCPCTERHAHGDKNVSFAVWEGDDGWLHFKCQTGCTEDEILAALGMSQEDRRIGPKSKPAGTEYDYTDPQGNYVFTKVRIPSGPRGKTFQLKDKRTDVWKVSHIPGWQDCMYRAKELAAAVADGRTVYLCEGEKAVDALMAAGECATCQPLGADEHASKWRDAHTKALLGADVVIVADRDEVGEDYAVRVAAKIQNFVKSVRLVQSLTEGEADDVYDHLKAGHPLDRLVTMNGKATDAMMRALSKMEPQRHKWVKASDVTPVKIDWLWEPYLPIGEVSMIVGDPGEGKSTVAQAIVTAATLGAELFGEKVRSGPAVFLSAEQSVAAITVPRFAAMGADMARITLPDEVAEDGSIDPFTLDKPGMDELRALCMAERPVIVVIDTVTAYIEASRDFNSANQTREWMRRLAEIARATPCAVVLLGHLNKNQNAHPLQRVLGSVDFVGASRSVILVGHEDSEFGFKRGIVQIKSNVGPFGDPRGFSLDEGSFTWTDGSELNADRMLQPPAMKNPVKQSDKCEEWMRGLFKDTDMIAAPSRDEKGKTNGFTTYMVDQAKKKLGVVSDTDVFGDGKEKVWKINRGQPWWGEK